MPVPPDFLHVLGQFATNDSVGGSLTAGVVMEAARRALTTLWRARPQSNVFDALWRHTAERVGADWPASLRTRVARIRGGFANGRIVDANAFSELLGAVGVNEDAAEMILAELAHSLHEALLDAARHEPAAFPPAVLNELVHHRWLLTQERDLLLELTTAVARIEDKVDRILDGLAHRPEEMLPPQVATPHEFTAEEQALLKRVEACLNGAPELIDRGQLQEAQDNLVMSRNDLVLLLERLREAAAPADQSTALYTLLARADIQLGTVAFEARQYRNAADIYQRAVDNARRGGEEETIVLSAYQTGVALASAREWRGCLRWFRETLRIRPGHSGALGNLAVALRELGEARRALSAYEELLGRCRAWAERDPEASNQYVAATLANLGTVMSDLGQRVEALAATEEALGLYRALAERDPEAFSQYVAATLNNVGSVLHDLGRRDQALAAHEEALAIRRDLASRAPDISNPDVAETLNNLGNLLRDLGRLADALAAHEEALATRRDLAARDARAFNPDVATTLTNLGHVLGDLGKQNEALGAHQEALAIRRQLAAREPGAFNQDVAWALNDVGIVLSKLGRQDESIAALEEALAIRRALATREPDAFSRYVATTLDNLGNVLKKLGRYDEALAAYEEALAIRRGLEAREPGAFSPGVARVLNNLGNLLRDMGRREEALAAHEEALAIRRKLSAREPGAFNQDLATTLNNLAATLTDLGRGGEALAAYQEAATLYELLVEAYPQAFGPGLAAVRGNIEGLRGAGE